MEVDVVYGKEFDLTKTKVKKRLMERARAKEFDVLLASPPCATFSRARYSGRSGPPALRSAAWLRGFPRLQGGKRRQVRDANSFIDFVVEVAGEMSRAGGYVLIEHPEDLGSRRSGDPGSIWRWPKVREAANKFEWSTGAFYQSDWGRSFSKPTRFLFNLPNVGEFVQEGWPTFNSDGTYLGPLTRKEHLGNLIGKDGHVFQTAASAAWPGLLCQRIAEIIIGVAKQRLQRLVVELSANEGGPQEVARSAVVAGPVSHL